MASQDREDCTRSWESKVEKLKKKKERIITNLLQLLSHFLIHDILYCWLTRLSSQEGYQERAEEGGAQFHMDN